MSGRKVLFAAEALFVGPALRYFTSSNFNLFPQFFATLEFGRSCHSTRLTRVVPTVVQAMRDHRPDKNIYSSLGQVIT